MTAAAAEGRHLEKAGEEHYYASGDNPDLDLF